MIPRASPVEIRKSLIVAQEFASAGIRFVAMPVLSEQDFTDQMSECARRLDLLAETAEAGDVAENAAPRV